MNRDDRDATNASRLPAAPPRSTDNSRQSADPGDRSRVRETDTTSKTVPPLADSIPQREARVGAGSVLDALGSAVAVVGADWRIQILNRQWERIFNRPPPNARGEICSPRFLYLPTITQRRCSAAFERTE